MTIKIEQHNQLMKQVRTESRTAYINKVFLDKITESLPQYIFWKDRNSVYLGCNKNFADLLGLRSPEEIVGKTDYDLNWQSTGHTAETFQEGDRKTLAGDFITNQEEILALPGGKKLITIVSKLPIIDESEAIGIVGYFTDITDRRRLEELARKNEIANQIIQRLKAISAGLSYEVRGPMAGIRLGLERTKQLFSKLLRLIKSKGGQIQCHENETISLEEIMEHQNLLGRMVQRIDTSVTLMEMQLKNMVTDHIEQRFFQPQSIKHSIEQAMKTFPLVDEALRDKIKMNIHCDFSICGDALLTKHLLWNLLHNALHTIQREGRGDIFITTEEMIDYHLLRFKDTARGMPAAHVSRIFEPFYTSDNGSGGLGLHFCQLVMKAYGGKIECYAQEGQHTEFLLFFPKAID